MNGDDVSRGLTHFGWDVLVVVAGGVVLAMFLWVLRGVVAIAPVSRTRREALRRALPLINVAAILLFCVYAVRRLLAAQPMYTPVVLVLLLAGFALAGWGSIRDIVAGVVLKATNACSVGDHVRIDKVAGRIQRLALRVIVIETPEGAEALVPYSQVSRASLLRTPVLAGVTAHVFELPRMSELSLAEQKERIRRAALLVHWSAVARVPEISVDEGHLEVTVYAVDPDRGGEIERSVREALGLDDDASPGPRSRQQPRSVLPGDA